tara:strand:- start:134 stop:385 length:252 start_codon:yes stop_codon:yes gene_type:complete
MVTLVTGQVTWDQKRNRRFYWVRVVLYLNYMEYRRPDWVFGDMRSGTPSYVRAEEKPGGEREIKTPPPKIPLQPEKKRKEINS